MTLEHSNRVIRCVDINVVKCDIAFDEDLAADGFGDGQVDDLFGDDDDIFNAPAPLPPLSPSNLDAGASNVGGAEDFGLGSSDPWIAGRRLPAIVLTASRYDQDDDDKMSVCFHYLRYL